MVFGMMGDMEKTIFEKIIDREIPADIVYEDDIVLAFLDIAPVNYGHTLIIPKKKFVNIFDGDPAVLAHMVQIGQKLARALKDTLHADGMNLVMNNEASAGQKVFHAHMHLIPRFENDEAFPHFVHRMYDDAKAKEIVASVRDLLQ